MTTIVTGAPSVAPNYSSPIVAAEADAGNGLPPPSLAPMNASDPLSMMLGMVEEMNQLSLDQTERMLSSAKDKLKDQLQAYLKQMAEALAAAQKAAKKKKKSGGFFGAVAKAVGNIVGGTVGKLLATITQDPKMEKAVAGFVTGALQFSADLCNFSSKLLVALAAEGGDLDSAWKSVKAEAKELWESFKDNIIENPDFMAVLAFAVKVGAIAAAVASGGALSIVAVGIIVLLEVDSKTNLIADVVGEDAAPWVRGGLQIASAVMIGLDAGGGDTALRLLQGGAGVLQGAANVNAGLKLLEEAKREAAEIRRQAQIQETLNRMQQTQRLIDDLLIMMEESAENRTRTRSMANGLMQLQCAANEATIMRA